MMFYPVQLSFKSMLRNPLPVVVSCVGLAAVLTPLLILYGLKSGVVEGMIDNLRSDPAFLRVDVSGNVPLTDADIAELRARPEVGFVVGAPRSLAAKMEFARSGNTFDLVEADIRPSMVGDPLLPEGFPPLEAGQVGLSESLAQKLKVSVGDTVVASRYRNSDDEALSYDLEVALVVPARLLGGLEALLDEPVVAQIGAFSDNYAVPERGITGTPLSERIARHDSVRLYAASIETVIALDAIMSERGFKAKSNAANITWVKSLEAVMNGIFAIITIAGVLGYLVSLMANIASTLRQSRQQLSLMRLLGMSSFQLSMYPMTQIFLIATLGLVVSLSAASAVALFINQVYLTDMFDGRICDLRASAIVVAIALSYGLTLTIGHLQFQGLKKIPPSEALKEHA
ncbi:FtsX-like permease family protein [Breoghania sp. L-A4]|uniref:ABC transporter permease n=1 Tax=Breoghania sp. L-A4 TaxID=2304600 RepID=UPI000E35C7CA|nr:FtsX-like permease family protein [Breoghania sp. L-A4]AXS40694.1 ABC transporter permease [Breoghania sp. L-A4]